MKTVFSKYTTNVVIIGKIDFVLLKFLSAARCSTKVPFGQHSARQ